MENQQKIREAVREIVDVADFDTKTPAQVHQQLKKKSDLDLSDRKQINAIILDVINERRGAFDHTKEESDDENLVNKPAQKRRSKKTSYSKSDEGDGDYWPMGKKSKGNKESGSDDDCENRKDCEELGRGSAKSGDGLLHSRFSRARRLSPELAKVMGSNAMRRIQVMKALYKLIKEKDLYDPNDKMFAICNDELLPVFGVKRFQVLGMMKYINRHLGEPL